MIGQVGIVTTALKPEGTIQFNGELWHARSKGPHLEPGAKVTVVEIRGLTLGVKEKEVSDD
jgi:membrane-bound ClpP family serine protease